MYKADGPATFSRPYWIVWKQDDALLAIVPSHRCYCTSRCLFSWPRTFVHTWVVHHRNGLAFSLLYTSHKYSFPTMKTHSYIFHTMKITFIHFSYISINDISTTINFFVLNPIFFSFYLVLFTIYTILFNGIYIPFWYIPNTEFCLRHDKNGWLLNEWLPMVFNIVHWHVSLKKILLKSWKHMKENI